MDGGKEYGKMAYGKDGMMDERAGCPPLFHPSMVLLIRYSPWNLRRYVDV
jgi:hypothetical protein